MFFGDAMLTPASSVLSAVEGLTVVEAGLQPLVLPIAVVILVALFLIQSGGTARVGALFGPIVLVYFATLATLGVANIAAHPERSEEHTSELQSLMRNSYAVFCLKKKKR